MLGTLSLICGFMVIVGAVVTIVALIRSDKCSYCGRSIDRQDGYDMCKVGEGCMR